MTEYWGGFCFGAGISAAIYMILGTWLDRTYKKIRKDIDVNCNETQKVMGQAQFIIDNQKKVIEKQRNEIKLLKRTRIPLK